MSSSAAMLMPSRTAGAASSGMAAARQSAPPGTAHWLDDMPPQHHEGMTWGQPWPRGTRMAREYRLSGGGAAQAVQSWPLAWWPDGSVKWTGHAVPANGGLASELAVEAGRGMPPAGVVQVREAPDAITVTAGDTVWTIGRQGSAIIRQAVTGGRAVLRDVGLVATALDRSEDDADATDPTRLLRYAGRIERVTVEQSGPIRAVVRVEGGHEGEGEQWLPFSLRLYFHAGSASVRIVHSLVFDGDPAHRFIRGLGLQGDVPMQDSLLDRHVRFVGQNGGLWAEAVRPLTGLRRDPGKAFRQAQIDGVAVPPLDAMAPAVRDKLSYIPAWGDFRLRQPNADGFAITKRTGSGHGWIDVDGGGRAAGLGYIGGVSGGVAFAMQDFWQRCPVGLDVAGATGETARFSLWYHAPDAPAMDLRFYHSTMGMADYAHQNLGLDITYEDFEPGWGEATGIARTTEFRLWALPATPPRERLVQMAEQVVAPPRIVPANAAIHAAGIFGIWGPAAPAGPGLRGSVEARATRELDFYLGQVDQRRWYGFWNYGDVMHSYDEDRHVWRYDIGGFAWDNSELSTDLWLWYAYLRTGRGDIFRMAEAMTRHTSEVDVYHLGRFKGFGTRHGVQHWGDSSKQPRISNAAFKRIFYYIAADERCGDLMHALIDCDQTLRNVEIGRKVTARIGGAAPPGGTGAVLADKPLPPGQVFVQFGTVWGPLVAAWMTEWERTRDTHWRDRIVAGMESLAALPKQWFAGGAPFDLASGRFVGQGDRVSVSHLNGVFGIFETMAELLDLVNVPAYRETWLDYCAFYNAPQAAFRAKTGDAGRGRGLTQAHSRFTAYAAVQRHDPALAKRAWAEFIGPDDRPGAYRRDSGRKILPPAVLKPVDELPDISTNAAAQWGLAMTANLVLLAPLLDGEGA
ncbi:exo-rhamnogalacturonan lyase family protein [Sphingomonas fuzhouensis]|uniref:exo-rhamnogalacturonan lyase family protein n=1 Tax=Sphingomonas fuzhouensis TaxID=3106033 RepID=UPI002AFE45F0|nr:Tat pathway signal sequence domain protein [Sphingomonas sp. SGZ-02]